MSPTYIFYSNLHEDKLNRVQFHILGLWFSNSIDIKITW